MDFSYLGEDGMDCASECDDDAQETAIYDLKTGKLSVLSSSGTLMCPFCAGKKKRDYRYSDLLQHATAISKGNRVKVTGVHRALAKYLKENLAYLAEPPQKRHLHLEQETPQRQTKDEQLVWPWMGIIMNIDNTKVIDGKHVGPGNNEIKGQFSHFNPKAVHTLWNFNGHLGMAVIEFNNDMIGYGDCQDFGRSFLECGRGKRDWESKTAAFEDLGKELYGWVANQQDYFCSGPIGKHLCEKGNLRTVAQVNEALTRQHKQLLQDLYANIEEKNKKLVDSSKQVSDLQSLVLETEHARRMAEAQKILMEHIHKQEIKFVEEEAKRTIQLRNDEIAREREKLDAEMKVLKKRCQELEIQEVHNDTERIVKETEINKNEKKMQLFLQIQELHKQQESKKIMLIKRQKEESKGLLVDQHRQHKNLVSQHKLELEIQAIEALIESKKLEANDSTDISKLEEQLKDLREEKEGLEDINQQLTYKERELNDEVQNATKAALKVLQTQGDDQNIGIKRMGELDCEPWKVACKEKYKNHVEGWEFHLATLTSEWEDNLRDGQWYPFSIVTTEDNKHERHIDESDEKLSRLRGDLGEHVYMTVIKALRELDEYNSSGRYPVSVAWNYKKNKKATLEEIIDQIAIEKVMKKKKKRIAR